MTVFRRAYRIFNFLSIDVVAGSVCCALFFSRLYQTTIVPNGAVVLALTVWLIYTADHLLDSSRMKGRASTGRHIFHKKYFRQIITVGIAAAIADAFLVLTLPTFVLFRGLIAGAFVILYLLFHRRLAVAKEFIAGGLYVTGLLIPLEALNGDRIAILVTVQFFTVVLMNLVLFSWFDLDKDKRQRTPSVVANSGRWIILSLFVLNGVIAVAGGWVRAGQIVFVMGVLHLMVFWFHPYFSVSDRYRMAGDAVFLLPLLYLL